MNPSIEQWLPASLDASRRAGVPKYVHLRNVLAHAIAEGKLAAGHKLPPEEALTKVAGLSLGTVQKALLSLVDDGLVTRKAGMGTFVAASDKPMHAPLQHCRFLADDGRSALPIYSRVLGRRTLGVSGKAGGKTSKNASEKKSGGWAAHILAERAICIERIFSIDRQFEVYTHLYLDAQRFPAVETMPLAKFNGVNFKHLLAREFHDAPAKFSETLSVQVFPLHVCKALKQRSGMSGAVIEIVAYDRRGAALYFQDLWIPPNGRRLVVGV